MVREPCTLTAGHMQQNACARKPQLTHSTSRHWGGCIGLYTARLWVLVVVFVLLLAGELNESKGQSLVV